MFVTAELRVRNLSNLPAYGFFKPVYRTNNLSQLRISHELSNRSSGTGFTYLKGQRVSVSHLFLGLDIQNAVRPSG